MDYKEMKASMSIRTTTSKEQRPHQWVVSINKQASSQCNQVCINKLKTNIKT